MGDTPATGSTSRRGEVDPSLPSRQLRRVTATLCVTQIIAWGVLFYAFPVLAPTIADTEGWPLPTLMAAFTGTQVIAALVGLWAGRHLDLRGPRVLMTLGSALGVLAVLGLAVAPTLPLFLGACGLVGAAMAGTLYPPAFAALTQWAGHDRVRALTVVTLVGGLASTLFAPLTAVLEAAGSWRSAYTFLALPLALTAALHWTQLRAPWTPTLAAEDPITGGTSHTRRDPLLRDRRFLTLLATMTLAGFAIYGAMINLIPLLVQSGVGTQQAAVVLAVGGIGQVAGRIAYAPLLGRASADNKLIVVLLITTATTLAFATVPNPLLILCVISIIAGTVRGAFTLIQATAVNDRWGTAAYGARTSVLSGGVHLASAAAPWVGAVVAAALGGYAAAYLVLAGCAFGAGMLPRVGSLALILRPSPGAQRKATTPSPPARPGRHGRAASPTQPDLRAPNV